MQIDIGGILPTHILKKTCHLYCTVNSKKTKPKKQWCFSPIYSMNFFYFFLVGRGRGPAISDGSFGAKHACVWGKTEGIAVSY